MRADVPLQSSSTFESRRRPTQSRGLAPFIYRIMLKTDFKAVLAQDDLASIDRDLRFHPVRNDRPSRLTPEQIERFNRDGYIRSFRAFDAAEIADLRRYF